MSCGFFVVRGLARRHGVPAAVASFRHGRQFFWGEGLIPIAMGAVCCKYGLIDAPARADGPWQVMQRRTRLFWWHTESWLGLLAGSRGRFRFLKPMGAAMSPLC